MNKPCPGCGSTDIYVFGFVDDYSGNFRHKAACYTPDCSFTCVGDTEDEALTNWNRRTPGPATKEMLEWAEERWQDQIRREWTKKMFRGFIDEWKPEETKP
jgi:hypothetical protein